MSAIAISVMAGATIAVAPVPTDASDQSGSALSAGTVITLPTGARVTLPKDFDDMTIAELAKIGVVAGMGQEAGGASVTGERDDVVSPMTATGCNKTVCIVVEGEGLIVEAWETQVVLPAATCTFANFWSGTKLLWTSDQWCGKKGGQARSWLTKTIPFAATHGTQLCNTWTGVAGKPCITVKR